MDFHELAAVVEHGGLFHLRRRARHVDPGADAERAGGEGDALRVVAGGCGDHAACRLGRVSARPCGCRRRAICRTSRRRDPRVSPRFPAPVRAGSAAPAASPGRSDRPARGQTGFPGAVGGRAADPHVSCRSLVRFLAALQGPDAGNPGRMLQQRRTPPSFLIPPSTEGGNPQV